MPVKTNHGSGFGRYGYAGKVKVMGADLNMESAEFLRSEKIDALVYKNPYDKGFQGFQVLVDYVVKRIEPPKNINALSAWCLRQV